MNIVNVGYDSTNYYVIGSGPKLLIDVGWSGTMPKLMANLKRSDIAISDIRYLLATHFHPDHAGLAQEVKQAGVRLVVMEGQSGAIPVLKTYMKPINRYVDITLHDNLNLALEDSRAFLKSIGIAGEIISTPGHSNDSVTLVLDDSAAFTGDLTLPGFATEDAYETVLASWDKIRALHAKMVYPGHGPTGRPLPEPG